MSDIYILHMILEIPRWSRRPPVRLRSTYAAVSPAEDRWAHEIYQSDGKTGGFTASIKPVGLRWKKNNDDDHEALDQ